MKKIKFLLLFILVVCCLGFILGVLSNFDQKTNNDSIKIKKIIRRSVVATAYSSDKNQTDDTPWINAANKRCRWGTVACNFLPLGTKIKIYGFKDIFIVEDRMNRRFNDRIDIWFPTKEEAIKFGKRKVIIEIIKKGDKKCLQCRYQTKKEI